MATKDNIARKSANKKGGSQLPLLDVVMITLRHWPWILVSLAVCMGAAWLYLQRTPNTYSRSADIMIKDDKKGNSTPGVDDFGDFGLFQSNTNIANEIKTLESLDLMMEVVQRLNLDINYSRPGTFRDNVAYGDNLPLNVDFVDFPAEGTATFHLMAKNDEVTLSDVVVNDTDIEGTFKGHLNDTIHFGRNAIVVKGASNPAKINGEVELNITKIPVASALVGYANRLKVEKSDKDGTVIHLTVNDQSIQRADDILNAVIGVYNENWIRDKNQIAVSTSNFINDRLGVIEGELGNVDNDISSYKSQNLIPDVDAAAQMYTAQNQQISSELMDLNNQLQMARYIRSYLTADSSKERLLPVNTGITDMNLQSGISEYNDIVMRRNSMISKSSDKNPLVLQLDEQLNGLRASIISAVDNYIIGLNTKTRSLQGTASKTTAKLASNPGQAKYLLSVERQQKVKESLYLFLLQKREENELSQAFTAYNTRIVNSPRGSGIPATPARGKIMAIAFLVGLFIPFGVTYTAETLNTKVRGRKDISNLSIPFLGEIPLYGGRKSKRAKKGSDDKEDGKIIVKPGKRDVVNEALRVVRTNLSFMNGTEEGKKGADTIAITSFNPGSGKSFIAMNLGRTLSLKEKSVLVIDGDMRRCTTSSYVGSPEHGLSDYLSGATNDVEQLIVQVPDTHNFYVLPVGTIPPNPAELLESPRFGKMLNELKTQVDTIIIDCPPIDIVADTQIIDRHVDRTVFIIRAGLFDRAMLPEIERLYDEKKYRNMAVILNGTIASTGKYGSHYGYGYGYAYGSGYGTYASSDKS